MPYGMGIEFNQQPEWYKTIIERFMKDADNVRNSSPYPDYKGERVAHESPFTLNSYDLSRNELGNQNKYFKEAANFIRPSQVPYDQQINKYMNPFLQNVLDSISKEGTRTFKEGILPALEAKFVNLGQHGSSRHRGLSERAARDLQSEIMNRQYQAMARGHSEASTLNQADQMRNLESGRMLGNLGLSAQMGSHQDINLLNALGAQQQSHKQQILNEQQGEFWRRQLWPHQGLQQQSSLMQGIPAPNMGSTFMNYQPPQAVPQVNTMGNLGGMAAHMYGMKQQYKQGGHIGLSRIRFAKRKKR